MKYLFFTSVFFLLVSVAVFAQKIAKEYQGTWYINNMSTDGGQSYGEFDTPKIAEVDSDKIILGNGDKQVTLNIESVDEKVNEDGITAYLILFKGDPEAFIIMTDGQDYMLVVADRNTHIEAVRCAISRTENIPTFNKGPQIKDGV
jgi:hypothetical protein